MLLGKFFLLVLLAGLAFFYGHTGRQTSTLKSIASSSSGMSPTPTSPATPSPTVSPTVVQVSGSTNTSSSFQYPNSTQTNQSNGQITFQSSDDPATITNWYKDKIKTLGLNVTTFVQTNTNNSILNTLRGANGSKSIDVEISKKPDDQIVI